MFEVVRVTAELGRQESPTTISEMTAEQIQSHSVNNLGEALELLPGVHFRVGRSKIEEQVTVRGFEQEKVLILMDGIPVSIPYEGQINLGDIPVQNIAKITLIKGLSSVLYGANGMGGVINIITKHGEEKPSLSAQYEGSQYASHNIQVGHGWKKGPFSYYAAFGHRESNGYPLARTFTLSQDILNNMARRRRILPPCQTFRSRPMSIAGTTATIRAMRSLLLRLSSSTRKTRWACPLSTMTTSMVSRPRRSIANTGEGFYYFPRYWRFTDWNRTMVNVLEESRISDSLSGKSPILLR